MKRLAVIFMLVAVLAFSLTGIQAFAASSEIIDSAVIDAVVNADGTVNVTETWTVSYISSSDYFYRNIDIYSADGAAALIEKYDDIADVAVKIDGRVAEKDSLINTFTFGKAENGRSYVIAVNCPSAQVTREYEISYTLIGAVKKQGGDAVFAHMFFGKEFIYTSNNASVTVTFPDGTAETFVSTRVYDTFSVEARADKELFENGALVKYSAAAEALRNAASLVIKALPAAFAVIIAVTAGVLVLFGQRLVRLPREKAVKRFKKNSAADTVYAMPEGITACEVYKMMYPVSAVKPGSSAKKVPVLFAAAILECAEKGYIIEEDGRLVVGTPSEAAPAYIMSVLNFLKVLAEKENDRYVLDARFAEKVNAECAARYDVMTNYLASFYSLIGGAGASFFRKEKNKELYENAYAFRLSVAEMKHKPAFAQCMENVLAGGKVTDAQNFAMLFASSPDKLFSKGGNEGTKALCEALYAMSRVYTKSK